MKERSKARRRMDNLIVVLIAVGLALPAAWPGIRDRRMIEALRQAAEEQMAQVQGLELESYALISDRFFGESQALASRFYPDIESEAPAGAKIHLADEETDRAVKKLIGSFGEMRSGEVRETATPGAASPPRLILCFRDGPTIEFALYPGEVGAKGERAKGSLKYASVSFSVDADASRLLLERIGE